MARQRALTTIDGQLQSARVYAAALVKRQQEIVEKKQSYGNKPVPSVLDRELESIEAELTRQLDLVAQKQKEVMAITAKYDADKQRWRELVAAKATTTNGKSAPPAQGSGAGVVPVGGTAKK